MVEMVEPFNEKTVSIRNMKESKRHIFHAQNTTIFLQDTFYYVLSDTLHYVYYIV